jgi:hypothetical protein
MALGKGRDGGRAKVLVALGETDGSGENCGEFQGRCTGLRADVARTSLRIQLLYRMLLMCHRDVVRNAIHVLIYVFRTSGKLSRDFLACLLLLLSWFPHYRVPLMQNISAGKDMQGATFSCRDKFSPGLSMHFRLRDVASCNGRTSRLSRSTWC